MTKVYLVWQGSYSDASVVGVFSTKDAANKLAAMDPYDTHVEEFEIDAMKDYAERGLKQHLAWSKGMTVEVEDVFEFSRLCPPAESDLDVCKHKNGQMFVHVMARDEEHAIKIAADKFRGFLALNGGK